MPIRVSNINFSAPLSKKSISFLFYPSSVPLVSIDVWEDEDQNSGLVNLHIHYSTYTWQDTDFEMRYSDVICSLTVYAFLWCLIQGQSQSQWCHRYHSPVYVKDLRPWWWNRGCVYRIKPKIQFHWVWFGLELLLLVQRVVCTFLMTLLTLM